MVNTDLLKKRIKKSGLKKGFIAEQLGLTSFALSRKINNLNQFKADEIHNLCNLLNINDLKKKEEIFFAKDVDKMPTSKEG